MVQILLFLFKNVLKFILERESEQEWERGRERGRESEGERVSSRPHARTDGGNSHPGDPPVTGGCQDDPRVVAPDRVRSAPRLARSHAGQPSVRWGQHTGRWHGTHKGPGVERSLVNSRNRREERQWETGLPACGGHGDSQGRLRQANSGDGRGLTGGRRASSLQRMLLSGLPAWMLSLLEPKGHLAEHPRLQI